MNKKNRMLQERAVKANKRLNRERTKNVILAERAKSNPDGWGKRPIKAAEEEKTQE